MRSRLYEIFLNSIFPVRCPVCGGIADDPKVPVCPSCLDKLSFVSAPLCSCCGKPVVSSAQKLCLDCTGNLRSFSGGASLLCYDETAREMMVQIKYHNKREYIPALMKLLYIRCKDRIDTMQAECIIPVPIHPDRRRERGFNQAELMARELGTHTGLPVRCDILTRNRKTGALKSLDPEERMQTLREAFGASGEAARYSTVILADDIYTTGSTVQACTQALIRAGVKKVYFVTICIGSEV